MARKRTKKEKRLAAKLYQQMEDDELEAVVRRVLRERRRRKKAERANKRLHDVHAEVLLDILNLRSLLADLGVKDPTDNKPDPFGLREAQKRASRTIRQAVQRSQSSRGVANLTGLSIQRSDSVERNLREG